MFAKQSTGLTLIVGPVLDSAGAEYTSAVIGDLSISKNGGTLTALAAAATLTHIANGQYTLVLTTGNTDTLGVIQITCNKSTYQMPTVERHVVTANVYDSLISGSDALQVDTIQITGTAQTAGDIAARLPAALVGGRIDANVGAISADATAADTLESYLDGTEFMPVDAYKPVFTVVGTTLTVKKPDGTTTAYTKTLSTDPAAEPVVGAS